MRKFKRWDEVPKEFKTKTGWSEQGLKPKKNEKGEMFLIKVPLKQQYKPYEFFTIEQTEPKRKITKNHFEGEITKELLAEALYVINKSAKKSRETKKANYDYAQGLWFQRHERRVTFGVVSTAKKREQRLYELKDEVIKKMHKDGLLKIKGYHLQTNPMGQIYLILYETENFTFHVPTKEKPDFDFLGDIGIISSEVTVKTSIGFKIAEEILKKYLEKNNCCTTKEKML
jgi:G3E family GTPase